jgi:ketosteroid isomerase-like protein
MEGLVSRRTPDHDGAVAFDVDRLLRLWTDPLPADDVAETAFREVYADPVVVNGARLTAADLVVRARALQQVFEQPEQEVLAVVDGGRQVAVAFRLRGRQIGTLATSAGPLPPTGRDLDLRVIDVLTIEDGRINEIRMVADELGALVAVDAVRLLPAAGEPAGAGDQVAPDEPSR